MNLCALDYGNTVLFEFFPQFRSDQNDAFIRVFGTRRVKLRGVVIRAFFNIAFGGVRVENQNDRLVFFLRVERFYRIRSRNIII